MNTGGVSRLRALGGLLAGGLVAGACVATVTPPTTAPMVAPASATLRPAVVTAAPTLPATLAPTSAPPTGPTPPEAAREAMSAFLSAFATAEAPFRISVDIDGTVTTGEGEVTFDLSMEGNVSGQDFDGEIEMPFGKAKVRFVDGTAYARFRQGTWIVDRSFEQTQPLNPFSRLEPSDLVYVETLENRGKRVHVLHTERWLGGPLEVEGVTDLELLSSDFAFDVRDDGIPVRGVLDFELEGTTAQGRTQFNYHVVYRFSRVGKPVTIEAPPV